MLDRFRQLVRANAATALVLVLRDARLRATPVAGREEPAVPRIAA